MFAATEPTSELKKLTPKPNPSPKNARITLNPSKFWKPFRNTCERQNSTTNVIRRRDRVVELDALIRESADNMKSDGLRAAVSPELLS